jgi:hypothetical protein
VARRRHEDVRLPKAEYDLGRSMFLGFRKYIKRAFELPVPASLNNCSSRNLSRFKGFFLDFPRPSANLGRKSRPRREKRLGLFHISVLA